MTTQSDAIAEAAGKVAATKQRCSGLPTFIQCASSAQPTQHPYNPTSEAAELGTAVHHALAVMAKGGSPNLIEVANAWGCDHDELAKLYHVGREAWGGLQPYLMGEVAVEVPLEGQAIKGTGDVLGMSADEAMVVDWKSGRLRHNFKPQLMGYALLARELYGPRDEYRMACVWLQYGDTEIESASNDDLDRFAERLETQSRQVGKQYAPGEACRFCQRQLVCGARAEFLRSSAQSLAEADTNQELLTPELLAMLWPRATMLEKALKRYREAVRLHVEQHGELPLPDGKRLVQRWYETETIDPKIAWPVLTQQHGMTRDDMSHLMSIGSGKLKAKVAERVPRGGKAEAQAQVMQDLRDAGAVRANPYSKMIPVKGSN